MPLRKEGTVVLYINLSHQDVILKLNASHCDKSLLHLQFQLIFFFLQQSEAAYNF